MEDETDIPISARARQLLKALVELYIEQGRPVASRALVANADVFLSSATVRNVLAGLEKLGLLKSPHTSAGRVPTQAGLRYFVDKLVDWKPLDGGELASLRRRLNPDLSTHELVESASGLVSEVTGMAGVVTLPRREQAPLRHVEFLRLSRHRVLAILVLRDHEVVNQLIHPSKDYSETELQQAANYLCRHFAGESLPAIRSKVLSGLERDSERLDSLMQTIGELVDRTFQDQDTADCVVAGQEKLIELAETKALLRLKDLFTAFSVKRDILELLEPCLRADGLHLLIGEESGYQMLDPFTVIASPYRAQGRTLGVVGIIGPKRMPYRRIIPLVNATASALGAALAGAAYP